MHLPLDEPAGGFARDFDPRRLERPDPALLKYYGWISLLSGPMFPFVFAPLLCKYLTMRYRFDDDGVSMSWGVLFRREIYLTYRRIQDIHLTRNILQRWMGLASVAIQTASGSSAPEMTIEGVLEADSLRDYLYARMRGAKGASTGMASNASQPTSSDAVSRDEVLALLVEIRDAISLMAQPVSTSAADVRAAGASSAGISSAAAPNREAQR